ncbi:hypothetical protein HN51_027838 [Arachis hypogaea]
MMASGGSTSVASRRRGRRTMDDVFSVDSGSTGEKQGYCDFFVWFDEIFGYLVDDVVERGRLASVETCVGEEFVAGSDYCLEERVKQLEEMLIKRNEDSSKLKKDSVLSLFSSVIIGALVVVIMFCIYVVVI